MIVKEIKTILDILAILLIMLNSILIVTLIYDAEKLVLIPLIFFSMVVYISVLYLQSKL